MVSYLGELPDLKSSFLGFSSLVLATPVQIFGDT